MAITDKKQGIWETDQVYNKIMEGDIWSYNSAGQRWAWGANPQGAYGNNIVAPNQKSSPTQVGSDEFIWNQIVPIDQGGMGVKNDGTFWTWGRDLYGRLAFNDGHDTKKSSPVQLGTDTNWSFAFGAHYGGFGGLKTDGTLWTWGRNQYGQAGTNTTTPGRSSPVQVPGTTWEFCESNSESMLAIKTDGSLWAWGRNEDGELGQNDKTTYSSPRQIPGSWAVGKYKCAIGKGTQPGNPDVKISYGIKDDGTLWAWGDGFYGLLGQNESGPPDRYRSSPVQIGTGTDWKAIATQQASDPGYTQAFKTDGTMWMWGYAIQGALGINLPGDAKRSSPTQIPGTNWTYSEACFRLGRKNASAIKTDGTMWVWGSADKGQTGQNDGTTRSSPIQIPGTWSGVGVAAEGTVFALKGGLMEE